MSLRLIEVILPTADAGRLSSTLEEQHTIGIWTTEMGDEQTMARILVPTGYTEGIADTLSTHFGQHATFRLMLFTVEATVPQPEEPEPEQTTQPDEQPPTETQSQRVSREELYQDIAQGAQFSRVYLVTVVLSTLVAAVGVLRGDVAVIIGAMVIAPLLGPNVALALASTLGDIKLAVQSIRTLLAGIATATVLSLLIGFFGTVDPTAPEIASRTQVGTGSLVLALAAGSAGALAFTTGIPAGVIGVMVAVALLPPLVVAGLLFGAGYMGLALNALLLFLGNVACINLAGVVTFLTQQIRPRTWWEARNAGRATRIAMLIWGSTLAVLLAIILLAGA